MRHLITPLATAALLFACNTEPECVDNGQCGDMQACIDDRCEDVSCLDSVDCTLHQFCDTKAYTCRDGCADDDDCKAGETCTDDRTCKSYGCRNTVLDCALGKVCDEGTCREWPYPLCDVCDPLEEALGMQPCGPHASCWGFEGGPDVGFCFPECTPGVEDTCPNGFTCDVFPDNSTNCVAYCPTLLQNGWL